ncbi:MAG: hypothetical protein HOL40_00610, partial [Cellvibrionales bacterium]|nr:hypothetical protein [Cellvibrionales bacterium]
MVRSVNTLKNIDNLVDSTANNTIDNTKNSDVNGDSSNNNTGNFTIEKSSEEIQIDFEVKSIQPTTENNIIHLLIAHEDPSEANKIKNIYKNSGWIVNAHRITSVEDLDES